MAQKTSVMQVDVGSVAMTAHADFTAETTNELLYGEQVRVLDQLEDEDDMPWAEIESVPDGYKGCVPLDALSDKVTKSSHFVQALRSFVYPEPDFKALPILALSFYAQVSPTPETQNGFVKLRNSGWVWQDHLQALDDHLSDYVATAERFVGTPYLWGGRTSFGLDCSALVQLSLQAAGTVSCPRDSKDQEKDLKGKTLGKADPLQRGDLVFFKGHVGIMMDEKHILNATARSMDTRIEKLSTIARHYNGITKALRL